MNRDHRIVSLFMVMSYLITSIIPFETGFEQDTYLDTISKGDTDKHEFADNLE